MRDAIQLRLRRVEGQLRGIQSMIAADADCERVVQQLAAARKALDKTFYQVVACSLKSALEPLPSRAGASIEQLTELLVRYG